MPGTGMGPSWPQSCTLVWKQRGPKVQGGWTWEAGVPSLSGPQNGNAAATRLCAATPGSRASSVGKGKRTGGHQGEEVEEGGREGEGEWEVRGWGGQEGRHGNGSRLCSQAGLPLGKEIKTFSIDFCLESHW